MPVSVFTEICRGPTVAPGATVIVTGTLVDVPPLSMTPVTPGPVVQLVKKGHVNTRDVAPDRFVPVMVADTVVPCAADAGEIDVITGCGSVLESSTWTELSKLPATEKICVALNVTPCPI